MTPAPTLKSRIEVFAPVELYGFNGRYAVSITDPLRVKVVSRNKRGRGHSLLAVRYPPRGSPAVILAGRDLGANQGRQSAQTHVRCVDLWVAACYGNIRPGFMVGFKDRNAKNTNPSNLVFCSIKDRKNYGLKGGPAPQQLTVRFQDTPAGAIPEIPYVGGVPEVSETPKVIKRRVKPVPVTVDLFKAAFERGMAALWAELEPFQHDLEKVVKLRDLLG